MKKKIRLDIFLSKNGLSRSREKAKREIISGWVKVNGETVHEPSRMITGLEKITIERPRGEFVSRGGEKLIHALKHFNISMKNKVAVDLGASTGGFTDCMLKSGASKVYAVDVGYGQLDFSLRQDSRVNVLERMNVKNLTHADFDCKVDFITVDLSFISILKVFHKIKELFTPVEGLILIKPQFEAGSGEHKKGVVRKKDIHKEILSRVLNSLMTMGMIFKGLCYSPIKGPAGNIEFLLYMGTGEGEDSIHQTDDVELCISKVVDEAHERIGVRSQESEFRNPS